MSRESKAVLRAGMAVLAVLLGGAELAGGATVTVDGSQAYQVIEGFGVNANHRSWNNSELQPVLDALIDQEGMTLFRVIFDKADWEATNDNSDPTVMNWDYYDRVYSSTDFQKMWDMGAYLNQRGITNGLMFNFQGNGPAWMGGSTLTVGYEDEWAEMIASLLVYARNTEHLQFSLVGPDNEEDITIQGFDMTASQYVTALHTLAELLDANGLSDVRFVGPDLGYTSTTWLSDMMADPVVMAKLAHFGLHSYQDSGGGSTGIYSFLQKSAYPDRTFWMTEFNVWCSTCEGGQGGTNSWAYASGAARYLLYHLANGASAGLVWEGYDSQYNYYSPGQWSYWGLFAVDDINAVPKTYTPRKIFYTLGQITRFVRPGARRIGISGSTTPFQLLAFCHPDQGQITLVGINPGTTSATLSAQLANLPPVSSLELYYTDANTNLCDSGARPVTGGAFTAVVPAKCVFTLVGLGTSGPPAQITVTPSAAVVSPYRTQNFTATATDAAGIKVIPQPTFDWSVSGGGSVDASGLFTAGGNEGGPFTVTAAASNLVGTASVSIAMDLNLAPDGDGYTWYSLTTPTDDSPQASAPGVNDDDLTADVPLVPGGTEDVYQAYEAAGVVWSAPQTINRVVYINGSYAPNSNGVFAAEFGLQFSPDGSTWTDADASWTVAPAYIYNSPASGDTAFTFTGGVATVQGVRCVGRVHTVNSYTNSWVGSATELQAFAPPPPPVMPDIIVQPTDQTVFAGATAFFNVAASGTPPLSYQWQFNGTNLDGAVADTLTFTNAQLEFAGDYSVIVTNVAGSVTSVVASLSVLVLPPVIMLEPSSQTVLMGDTASFIVSADGMLPLSYQWEFNGTNLDGAVADTLTLTNVQPELSGDYTVVVTNVAGSATSAVATLTVLVPPPTITLEPTNQTVLLGGTVNFSVAADGTPPLNYQWQFNGTNLDGAVAETLVLTNVQVEQAGGYSAIVANAGGTTNSAIAFLTVLHYPMLLDARMDTNGAFAFTLSGDAGWSYTIEVSTNLSEWTPLSTLTNDTGQAAFTDPGAPQSSSRFYRARLDY